MIWYEIYFLFDSSIFKSIFHGNFSPRPVPNQEIALSKTNAEEKKQNNRRKEMIIQIK